MKKLSKKAPLIALASLTAVGIIGGTMAYYTNSNSFVNEFRTIGYNSETYEIFNPDDADHVKPSDIINKDVFVKNTGNVPMLIRVQYIESIDGSTPTPVQLNTNGSEENPWIASVVNGNKFQYQDGYYYYLGTLNENEKIQHLDSITLWDNYNINPTETVLYGYKTSSDSDIQWAKGTINSNDDTKVDINGTTYTLEGEKHILQANGSTYSLTVKVETIQATDSEGTSLDSSTLTTATNVASAWNDIVTNSQPDVNTTP